MLLAGEVHLSRNFGRGTAVWGDAGDTPVADCRVIEGGIYIAGTFPAALSEEASALSMFDNLEYLRGEITIASGTGGEDFSGFPQLREMGGLSSTSVGGLDYISGFPVLTQVNGGFYAPNLTGARNLQHVEGSLALTGGNPNLPFLQTVSNNLDIAGVDTIQLPMLKRVEGTLWIEDTNT